MSLDVRLKRVDRIYREGEKLSGVVVVQSKSDMSHGGITLTVEGMVNMQLSSKSVGVFEAFYNSIRPVQLLYYTLDVAGPGKLPGGTTELPFEVPLKAKEGQQLYETYKGVFVNIEYSIKVDMQRSLLNKSLSKRIEFFIESESLKDPPKPVEVPFTITPESLQTAKRPTTTTLPNFKVTGKLHSATCPITMPFTGELTVEHCDMKVKSIELQLVRVETCATEIQNIQIGDGDVCRGMSIPMHMIFPRLFTCPTIAAKNFKVEFEVNVVILLQDHHLITENFPIRLYRTGTSAAPVLV